MNDKIPGFKTIVDREVNAFEIYRYRPNKFRTCKNCDGNVFPMKINSRENMKGMYDKAVLESWIFPEYCTLCLN